MMCGAHKFVEGRGVDMLRLHVSKVMVCHFKVGISWMPKNMNGSFYGSKGKWLPLYTMRNDSR